VKCRKPPGVEFGAPILTERGLVPCSSADDAALLKKAVGVAERTDAVGVDVRGLGYYRGQARHLAQAGRLGERTRCWHCSLRHAFCAVEPRLHLRMIACGGSSFLLRGQLLLQKRYLIAWAGLVAVHVSLRRCLSEDRRHGDRQQDRQQAVPSFR